jgi:hypothetical protein
MNLEPVFLLQLHAAVNYRFNTGKVVDRNRTGYFAYARHALPLCYNDNWIDSNYSALSSPARVFQFRRIDDLMHKPGRFGFAVHLLQVGV